MPVDRPRLLRERERAEARQRMAELVASGQLTIRHATPEECERYGIPMPGEPEDERAAEQ